MRVHYLQHVPFEGLGCMEGWLTTNGHSISSTRLYEEAAIMPSIDEFDGLVIMGGPMNVNEEQEHPWLGPEKELIREAIEAGKKILGVCLGAQLIAAASGGEVFANTEKEIGWFPVNFQSSLADWLGRDLTAEQMFFHWHGDTYTLPGGFINHANTKACRQQLYTSGDNIVGIQFHPEMTAAGVKALVKNDSDELQEKSFIQTEQTILSTVEHFEKSHAFMAIVLERLFR